MKINLLILFTCCIYYTASAQSDTTGFQKNEEYCILRITGVLFSAKVTIDVDYGEKRRFGDNRIREEVTGKLVKFNSAVDAMNYLGEQGWKLVNAFPDITNGTSCTVYVFKRDKPSATDSVAGIRSKHPGH